MGKAVPERGERRAAGASRRWRRARNLVELLRLGSGWLLTTARRATASRALRSRAWPRQTACARPEQARSDRSVQCGSPVVAYVGPPRLTHPLIRAFMHSVFHF